MSKPLIYLIAIFCLWLYFRYGNFDAKQEPATTTIEEADAARSGYGGVRA